MNPEKHYLQTNKTEVTYGDSFTNEELGPIPEDLDRVMGAISTIEVTDVENAENIPSRLEKLDTVIDTVIDMAETCIESKSSVRFVNEILPALRAKTIEVLNTSTDSAFAKSVAELLEKKVQAAKERPEYKAKNTFVAALERLASAAHTRVDDQRGTEVLGAIDEV